MNDISRTRISEILYVALCQKIGFPTIVTIRRDVMDLQERTFALLSKNTKRSVQISGSHREGFRFKGSDVDYMIWPTTHKVIWDYNQTDFYQTSDTTLIMMEYCDTRPGFTLLELLTETNDRIIRSACVKMNDKLYISSSLYRERTLSSLDFKCTIHGPCASGRIGIWFEYDLAHCFSCDFWPQFASSFVERSQMKGWPPANVVKDIIDSGCHVVPIGRRNSQEKAEWRMSFSVAEQKLVYAMTHCQFLCYGMLKIFLKDILNSNSEESLICSYFLKTALFWQIQEQENSNWTPQNILHCIWQCVKYLIKCVYKGECPNFFIPTNNMFYNKVVGSARQRLLVQLQELYDEGESCLLRCPSILQIIEKIEARRRYVINTDENFWITIAERDAELFHQILVAATRYSMSSLSSCHYILSVFERMKRTPLSVYQALALQHFTTVTLLQTGLLLHFVKITTCYTNKARYNVVQKICHIMKLTAKNGNVSNILNIAMYYYKASRFKRALFYVEVAKVKLSRPYLMCALCVDTTRYIQVVHGMSLSTRLRETCVFPVMLYRNCIFILELTLEMKAQQLKVLTIPPHVMVSLLSVLCHRDNPRKQQEAINDLHTLLTHDNGTYIPPIHRNIAWQILGISQQMHGDLQSALISYQEALKYTERQENAIEETTKVRIQHVQHALAADI